MSATAATDANAEANGEANAEGNAKAADLETAATPPLCGPPLPWECSIFDAVTKDTADASPLPVTEGSAILPPFVAVVGSNAPVNAALSSEAGIQGGPQIADSLIFVIVIAIALVWITVALSRRGRRRKTSASGPQPQR